MDDNTNSQILPSFIQLINYNRLNQSNSTLLENFPVKKVTVPVKLIFVPIMK